MKQKELKKLKRELINQPIELTPKDIQKWKAESFEYVLSAIMPFSLLILRDKFGFGKVRLDRFQEAFMDLHDSVDKGYLTFSDIEDILNEETGVDVVRSKIV